MRWSGCVRRTPVRPRRHLAAAAFLDQVVKLFLQLRLIGVSLGELHHVLKGWWRLLPRAAWQRCFKPLETGASQRGPIREDAGELGVV
jgi:hypothetical protein